MFIYNNMTIKWEDDGNRYCMHIQLDDMAEDPRRIIDPEGLVTTMACWHRRRSLGDDIGEMDPEEFWRDLLRKTAEESDVNEAAVAGKLSSVAVRESKGDPGFYDISLNPGSREYDFEGVAKNSIVYSVLDSLSIADCQLLLHPYLEWLPVWGYEHSGLTIACGARTYPYNDRCDSGRLGNIVALKDKIVKNFNLDPNDDESWRQKAKEVMKSDVELYDHYLTGEVYGFVTFKFVDDGTEDGSWDEIDSCSGFYGDNPLTNGMAEAVGFHLKEALESGEYEQGVAQKHVCVTWSF